MTRVRCVVCGSEARVDIETAATSAPLTEVAARFGVSERTLKRHMAKHPRAVHAASALVAEGDTPPGRGGERRAPTPRNALVTLAPPAPAEPAPPTSATTATVEQAPQTERDDEDAPATSRSSELVGARARSARERLEHVLDRIEEILDELGDAHIAAKLPILRALVSPIRLLGQFTGEVGATETAVAASPFYRRTRAAIVEALSPPEFAAARDAVITALEQLEGGAPIVDRSEAAE